MTRLAIFALCAATVPTGCRSAPAPSPSQGEQSGRTAREREPATGAAVIFEARVKSIRIVQAEHLPDGKGIVLHAPSDTIVVREPDVRWLVTVEILKVRKGDAAVWSGEKRFAIHSPVRTFMDSADEAVGRTYVFYLHKHQASGGERFSLDVTALRP